MICRVAIHEQTPGSIASDEARGFREWIKEQPVDTGLPQLRLTNPPQLLIRETPHA